MLKIWGRSNSANVRKALWIAEELGLAYERVDVGGPFGGLDDPAYLAKNPNGLIPLLEDGDALLWESNVIVRYLAAKHADKGLWIDDPLARAQGEKWMDWASTALGGDFRDAMMNLVRLPPDKRDPALAKRGVENLARAMRIADQGLADRPWFSGKEFGVGDIPLGCYVYGWMQFDIDRPALPRLEDWYRRLQARPAYRKAVMTPN